MIDHIGISVPKANFAEVVAFYVKALAPLGYSKKLEFPDTVGFEQLTLDFWIHEKAEAGVAHLAFTANDRATVDAFHEAALKAGGEDNGPVGPRHYHPHYYGGFIKDPVGNNLEVCCHLPEAEASK